jgi:hypothetical protein
LTDPDPVIASRLKDADESIAMSSPPDPECTFQERFGTPVTEIRPLWLEAVTAPASVDPYRARAGLDLCVSATGELDIHGSTTRNLSMSVTFPKGPLPRHATVRFVKLMNNVPPRAADALILLRSP